MNGTHIVIWDMHRYAKLVSYPPPKKRWWTILKPVNSCHFYSCKMSRGKNKKNTKKLGGNTSWWLNQPIWKIWSSNWIISPSRKRSRLFYNVVDSCFHGVWHPSPQGSGWKFQKSLSCHHLAIVIYKPAYLPPGASKKGQSFRVDDLMCSNCSLVIPN